MAAMCKYFNIITQEQLDKVQRELTLTAHGKERPYFYPQEYLAVKMVCIDEIRPVKCKKILGSSIGYIYNCLKKLADAIPDDEKKPAFSTRDILICRDIKSGLPGYRVAQRHGITGARVSQIYKQIEALG